MTPLREPDDARSAPATRPRTALVIGGGVIGLCTAFELAERGVRVTLAERARLGAGASFGNAGLISIAHPPLPRPGLMRELLGSLTDRSAPVQLMWRFDPGLLTFLWRLSRACRPRVFARNMEIVAALSRLTKPLFERYAGQVGIEFEHRPHGYMDVYRDEPRFQRAREDAALVGRLGFEEHVLTGGEARDAEPALRAGVVGAVRHEASAVANPGLFVEGLGAAVRERGVRVLEERPIDRLIVRRGRVVGATGPSEDALTADVTVLAAGPWSTPIARTAGVRVPMRCGKGYHVTTGQPDPPLRRAVHLGGQWLAATPMNGSLRIAGLLDLTGPDLSMPSHRFARIFEGASAFLEGVGPQGERSRWCGLRPCTADGLPVIGAVPGLEGLVVNTGHAMMGFWSGPASGLLAAQAAFGETGPPEVAAMSPARFGRVHEVGR